MSAHRPTGTHHHARGSTPSAGAVPFCALCVFIPNFFDRSTADLPVSSSPSGRTRRNAASRQKKTGGEGTFSNLNQWRSSAASASSSSSSSSHVKSAFSHVNHMFQSLGVEFEKGELISSHGGDVVTRGDEHLRRLASACELQLQRLLARRSGANLPESVGGEHSPIAMSAAEWARKMVSVSLTFSEVLQLQGRPKEALEAMQAAQQHLEACMASDDGRSTVGLVLVREADLVAIAWGQKVDDQDSPSPSSSCVNLDPSAFTAASPGVFHVIGNPSLGGETSTSPRLGSVTREAAKFLQPFISCLLRIGCVPPLPCPHLASVSPFLTLPLCPHAHAGPCSSHTAGCRRPSSRFRASWQCARRCRPTSFCSRSRTGRLTSLAPTRCWPSRLTPWDAPTRRQFSTPWAVSTACKRRRLPFTALVAVNEQQEAGYTRVRVIGVLKSRIENSRGDEDAQGQTGSETRALHA